MFRFCSDISQPKTCLDCRYDLLVDSEDVANVLLCVLAVGHHVVGGVLSRLEHVPLLRQQEAIELA